MATFFVQVKDDIVSMKIMEHVIKHSLTYSKDTSKPWTQIEIIGSPNDFITLEADINKMNEARGKVVATITEAL